MEWIDNEFKEKEHNVIAHLIVDSEGMISIPYHPRNSGHHGKIIGNIHNDGIDRIMDIIDSEKNNYCNTFPDINKLRNNYSDPNNKKL